MSARGRHRRPKNPRLARRAATLALSAGGAGLILPLVSTGTASAASVDTWDKVAECESSGDWQANTGNGFFGGLQFTQSSWEAAGGTKYAPRADQATKDQQIAAAEELLAMQGPGAWPVCGPEAGLQQNGAEPDIDTAGGDKNSSGAADSADQAGSGAADTKKSAPKQSAQGSSDKATAYTVVGGDTLSKIARDHEVQGGWQAVYEHNRDVVGDDPNLIFPDQELTLGGADDAAESGSDAQAQPAPKKDKPEPEQRKSEAKSSPATQTEATGFTAPVDAPLSTQYGASGSSWSSGSHTGVDFSAPMGTPVKAVAEGTVVSAGWGGAYGNEVVIQHEDGRYSQYGHLSSLSVSAGQTVGSGDQLGLSGSTGNSTGPHLHFEVRTGPDYGSDIDPLAYLAENGVTL